MERRGCILRIPLQEVGTTIYVPYAASEFPSGEQCPQDVPTLPSISCIPCITGGSIKINRKF